MTDGKQISVAELLARNGQENGAPQNAGGRRRRAGKNGGVSVASLTGDFPVVQPVENPAAPHQPEPAMPAQPAMQQPISAPMPVVQQPVVPQQPAAPNLAPQAFGSQTMQAPQAVPQTLPPQNLGQQTYGQLSYGQQSPLQHAPQHVAPQNLMQPQNLVQQPAPPQPVMPQPIMPQPPQPQAAPPQPAAPPQFTIQPPTTQATPSSIGPTAEVQSYSFGESSAVAQPATEPPAQPVKRRTRAERRAAEERARVQREAAAGLVSHARPEVAEQPVAEPVTYSAPDTSPTVITPPVMPHTHVVQPGAASPPPPPQQPPPQPLIDSSPTVMEAGSIPGLQPAAFDQASQTYAPPNNAAEATALTPTVPGKSHGLPKLRGFQLGRFGNQQRTDDAPTEIRQPDPKVKKGKGKADQQAMPAETDADATSIWPAQLGLAGARAPQPDEAPPQAEPTRAPAEPKNRKDKIRKPKKQPQRASAMDFPTAAWQMSSSEPQLLSGNASLAGDLLRQDPPRQDPLRSEALRADGLRSEALRSDGLRSDTMRPEALRPEPQRPEPPRSEPLRSEPLRSEALRSEPLRSEPLRSEPMRAEGLRSEPPRSEALRSEPMRLDPQQRPDQQRPEMSDHANTELIHPEQLLAGPSLAGELMRGGPEEPFEPTERYHNPEPDDEPTDVDHPFFSRGPGADFDQPLDPVDDLGEEEEERDHDRRAWWIQGGQWLVAGVSGVLLFKGFEVLWVHMAMVALALAVTVILGLVALVRILRRTDDILSLGIAVGVGVFVTLGPLAFTLQTG